jgi:hypothetical protein
MESRNIRKKKRGMSGFQASVPRKSSLNVEEIRWDVLNRDNDECRWPTDIKGNVIKDCNFRFTKKLVLPNGVSIVKMPRGTKIYHAITQNPAEPSAWYNHYETQAPKPRRGSAFFTSTLLHTGNFTRKTHVLEYELSKPILLIYEHNLGVKYNNTNLRGNDYMKDILPKYIEYLKKEYKIDVVGYAGCNECEIALINNAVEDVIKMPPKLMLEIQKKFTD